MDPRIAIDVRVGGIGDEVTVGDHPYQMEKRDPLATASRSEAMGFV